LLVGIALELVWRGWVLAAVVVLVVGGALVALVYLLPGDKR
jgi:hypothetical protein